MKQLSVAGDVHRRLWRYMGLLTMQRSEKVSVSDAIEQLLNTVEATEQVNIQPAQQPEVQP